MNRKMAIGFFVFLGLAGLTACKSMRDSGLADSSAPAKVEAGQAKAQIAAPRAYEPVPEGQIGVNENGKGLEPGTSVDNVTLLDIHNNPYQLALAWKDQPALIVFYRGGWCPYCNMQVREMSEQYDALKAAGVQPILISVDAPDKTSLVSATYSIPFPVLSDPTLAAHTEFNVLLKLDETTLEKYRGYGLDLAAWSQQDHNTIAVASVFLIDQQGKVLFSHAPEAYQQRPSVQELLTVIEKTATN